MGEGGGRERELRPGVPDAWKRGKNTVLFVLMGRQLAHTLTACHWTKNFGHSVDSYIPQLGVGFPSRRYLFCQILFETVYGISS